MVLHGPSQCFSRLSAPWFAWDALLSSTRKRLGHVFVVRRRHLTGGHSEHRLATKDPWSCNFMVNIWEGLKEVQRLVPRTGLRRFLCALQLYVEVYCEDTAAHKVWHSVLPQLWSFNWHQEDFVVNDMEALPDFLFSDKCPAHVRLCLGHICEPDAPLVSCPSLYHK